MHHKQDREFTYETGTDEPLNPDPAIAASMTEHGVSKCENGCKLYKHPRADIIVLAHNSSYGCKRTKSHIVSEFTEANIDA